MKLSGLQTQTPVLPSAGPATIPEYFEAVRTVIEQLPYADIEAIKQELLVAYQEQRTVFIFGNGGSAATASHMICDLGKGVVSGDGARRFRVIALTDNVPMMTAWANDSTYEDIFAEQLANLARPGDIVLAISGSGNSPNVLKALRTARKAGARTLGFTGFQGGQMRSLCDICIIVPSDNMQVIEDMHHSVAHSLFTALRREVSMNVLAVSAR